jgi:hypothetical protein
MFTPPCDLFVSNNEWKNRIFEPSNKRQHEQTSGVDQSPRESRQILFSICFTAAGMKRSRAKAALDGDALLPLVTRIDSLR